MKLRLLGVAGLSVIALTACQTVTTGSGQIQNLNGGSAKQVQVQIEEKLFADHAKATITLPNGERFNGKFIIAKKKITESQDIFDFDSDLEDDKTVLKSRTEYSSKATGQLFSPRRSMECVITLADPEAGFSDGGNGFCTISTGQNVPIQF